MFSKARYSAPCINSMSNYLDNTQTRMIGISDHMRTFSSFPWCPLRTSLSTLWHIRMCLPSSHPSIDPSERQKAYGQRKETVSDNPMFKRRVDQVDQSCVHFHRCAYPHTLSSPIPHISSIDDRQDVDFCRRHPRLAPSCCAWCSHRPVSQQQGSSHSGFRCYCPDVPEPM